MVIETDENLDYDEEEDRVESLFGGFQGLKQRSGTMLFKRGEEKSAQLKDPLMGKHRKNSSQI